MNHNYPTQRMRNRLLTCIIMFIFCFSSLRVSAFDCTPPGATIATPDKITCGHGIITLNGQSSTVGASFAWSGPNGFVSFSSNPSVSLPGTYTLTVTSPTGGCTSTASVDVFVDRVQPDAGTQVSGPMTCANPTIAVNGVSSVQNATYSWIGPGSFTSNQQNLNVTVSGGYTLMVTNPANGCISTATAYVPLNVNPPTVSGYVSAELTCSINSVDLTSSSATSGVNYSWTGPGFSSPVLAQNTSTSVGGTYTVTATNPVNGCTSSSQVNVIKDISTPGATIVASNNVITCTAINANLSGTSPSVGVTYTWSGPVNIDVQNITVASAGTYVLTVTKAQNNCISTDTARITVDKVHPNAAGVPSGPITCTTSVVTLNGSSSTSGVTYKWLNSSGYLYGQNPTTSTSGAYILFVTNPVNGCMTSTPVVVKQNVSLPVSVSATNNGPITCTTTSVTLNGSSATSGVTYSWSGPNGSIFTGANPSVSAFGTYSLKVTDPTNGCYVTTSTIVAQDKALPASVTTTNNGPITCLNPNVTLSGSSSTTGATYQWKDQAGNILSNLPNAVVNAAGLYSLVVTNPSNGCTAIKVTPVSSNLTKPALVSATNSGPLTCSTLTVTLDGNSATSGVGYSWIGPGNFGSTSKDPSAGTPGRYYVTITNTQNGCTDTTSTFVATDLTAPGASIGTPAILTCNATTINIPGNSPSTNVKYSWTGPGTFVSTEQNPSTNTPGNYTLTVTNLANNCTSNANVTVLQDISKPTGVTASAPDMLTCTRLNVALAANSGTSNVTYGWTGPAGFTSAIQNPTVTAKGSYVVTVTKQSNGCSDIATAVVAKDTLKPADVSAIASGILNCANANVTLTGSSSTPGVNYSWNGPGLTSSLASVSTGATGTYNLTVTNPNNGCFKTTTVTVTENHTSPAPITVGAPDKLTCSVQHVTITASAAVSGTEYSWTGPDNFASNEQTPSVGIPGVYTVKATHPVSRCFATQTVTVLQDTVSPVNVNASPSDIITCDNTTVNLNGSSGTSGVNYSWTGPNGFTSGFQTPIVSDSGLYILTVTNPLNGCSKIRKVTVVANTIHPQDVTAVASNVLDCNNPFTFLTGSSSTPDVLYLWSASTGVFGTDQFASTSLAGNYTLTVIDPVNGCSTDQTVTVFSNFTQPACSLSIANNSTVLQLSNNTISTVYAPSYSYSWSITNWTSLSGQNTQTLTYKAGATGTTSNISVNILDSNNGCTNTCGVTLSAVATKSAFAEEAQLPVQTVQDLTLRTYPIPSVGKVYVEFASPEQTDATVTVYNTYGSVVETLFSNSVNAGQNYQLVFNESENLPAGVYICVIKTKTKIISNKIILK